MNFFDENRNLRERIENYTIDIEETVLLFAETVDLFFAGREQERMNDAAKRVREAESKCDTCLREIEYQVYSGAVVDRLQTDFFLTLELLDKIPNKAEHVANFTALAAPDIPPTFNHEFRDIMKLTLKCTDSLTSCINGLFTDINVAVNHSRSVARLESAIDSMERHTMGRIFRSGMDIAGKLLLREFLVMLCSIADRAENAANQAELLATKMKRMEAYAKAPAAVNFP